jgi:DNA polymerase elongation subunit (family B)
VFFAFHVAGMEITRSGVLLQNMCQINQKRLRPFKMEIFDTELDLLNGVVDLVIELDPDILTGWDVQQHSWGFLEARGLILGVSEFGRRQDLESDKTKASASQILSPVRLRGNLGLRP